MKNVSRITVAVVVAVSVFMSGCDSPVSIVNETPLAQHFSATNLSQTAGSVVPVAITANPGGSPGAVVNIRYNGNAALPQTVGSFTVTFDVEAAPGWYAGSGLFAGNLIIAAPQQPDPEVPGDSQQPPGDNQQTPDDNQQPGPAISAPEIRLEGNFIRWDNNIENLSGFRVYYLDGRTRTLRTIIDAIDVRHLDLPAGVHTIYMRSLATTGFSHSELVSVEVEIIHQIEPIEPIQLDAPQISLDGTRLSWQPIQGAETMFVIVNGLPRQTLSADVTEFDLANLVPALAPGGTFEITMRAWPAVDCDTFTVSEVSSPLSITMESNQIVDPGNGMGMATVVLLNRY